MINYKLAKQLKDLGFKQTGRGDTHSNCILPNKELVYCPTLSELIDACEKSLYSKHYVNVGIKIEGHLVHDYGWYVEVFWVDNLEDENKGKIGSWEKTLIEAMAKLYIALNKNK